MTLKIHVMLIIFILYNLFIGKVEALFICYMFILMHELAHMIVALLVNVDITEIEFTPFGVNAKYVEDSCGKKCLWNLGVRKFEAAGEQYLSPQGKRICNRSLSYEISLCKEFLIGIAGPIASLLFAFLYNNDTYYIINICICIFNLVPIYPFDGGRILRVILKMFYGEERGRCVSTYVTTFCVVILFLVAIFIAAYYKNFFFLIMVVYILRITKEEIQKDKIRSVIRHLQF